MGNLLGEPFKEYVRDQIVSRQKVYGKQTGRTLDEIQYLNSRNAWIKLASGVSLEQERYDLLKGNPLVDNSTIGNDLAQKNILFNGLSSIKHNEEGIKNVRKGNRLSRQDVLGDNFNNFSGKKGITYQGYNHRAGIEGVNRAYGVGGTDFGYSPMPGIVDMDFKCLNRGSIKKASLNIKAHNKNQFDVIDVLYLRLGYSVFLEWGYDKYIDNDGKLQNMQSTLIDHEFWKNKYNNSNYSEWLPLIEDKREETKGNYDGIFGTISNFSWTFNNDGSYDIKVEIISLGDVIESLKVNLPSKGQSKDEFEDLKFTQMEETYGISKEFFETYPVIVKKIEDFIDNEENYKNRKVGDHHYILPEEFADSVYVESISKGDNNYYGIKDVKIKNEILAYKSFDYLILTPEDLPEGEGDKFVDEYGYEKSQIQLGIPRGGGIKIDNLRTGTSIKDIDKTKWKLDFFQLLVKTYGLKGSILDEENEEVGEYQQELQKDLEKKDINRIFEYFYNIKYTFFNFTPEGMTKLSQELPPESDTTFWGYETEKSLKIKKEYENLRQKFRNERTDYIAKNIISSPRGSNIVLNYMKKKNKNDDTSDFLIGHPLNPSRFTNTDVAHWNKTVGFPKYELDKNNSHDILQLNISPDSYSYFIRFGTFLSYLENLTIPKVGKTPLIKIDTDRKSNICYTIDNMVSNDIRKCLISNSSFYNGEEETSLIFYGGINGFQREKGGYKYGRIMDIYLNFSTIEEIFETTDEKDSVSLYKALKSMCDVINECLGDVNNLEPVITDSNTIKIIDQTPIPGIETISKKLGIDYNPTDEAILEVFGYSENKNKESTSNFVHSIGLTTEISKNYATMITIGATSNGSIPGAEATAFSKWNVGIEDRFKNQITDADAKPDDSLKKQNDKVLKNYNSFIKGGDLIVGLNPKEGKYYSINEEQIKLNKPAISNYYKYAQAESSKEGALESSIGFLPFNLKIDMDGMGGIKIYNKVKINTKFLPSNYPETLDFIITGVNHKLSGNDWTTSLETIATATSKLTK